MLEIHAYIELGDLERGGPPLSLSWQRPTARSRPRICANGNMADPFGNGFDLIEFPGPGYDGVWR